MPRRRHRRGTNQQRVDGERVPDVMQPRQQRRCGADVGLVAEAAEGSIDHVAHQARAVQRHKEALVARRGAQLVAPARVARERLEGAVVQRYVSRLVELRFADQRHAVGRVDIAAVELDRLADPQAGRGEQSDERLVGRGAQRLANRTTGLVHQRGDAGVAVDERRPPASAKRDQPGRRDLGPSIETRQVAREAAHDEQPHRGHDAAGRHLALKRPCERDVDRDVLGAGRVETGGEAGQHAGGLVELVAEGAAQPQVVLDVLIECGHRGAPGQGWAAWRRRARSTLA